MKKRKRKPPSLFLFTIVGKGKLSLKGFTFYFFNVIIIIKKNKRKESLIFLSFVL